MKINTRAKDVMEPEIINVKTSGLSTDLTLRIPEELYYFNGHFPGFKILPGVVQLDWVVRFARRYFSFSGVSASNIRVKFMRPILPGVTLKLSLTHVSENRIAFKFDANSVPCASGQITFSADAI